MEEVSDLQYWGAINMQLLSVFLVLDTGLQKEAAEPVYCLGWQEILWSDK